MAEDYIGVGSWNNTLKVEGGAINLSTLFGKPFSCDQNYGLGVGKGL